MKTSPGRGDWEDTIAHHRRCATLFASLMSLVRVQDRRPQVGWGRWGLQLGLILLCMRQACLYRPDAPWSTLEG